MINKIFIKEVQDQIFSNKMIIVSITIVALFLVNSLVFIKDFSDQTKQYQKINVKTQDALKNSSGNLWQLTFNTQKLTYPSSPLGFIAEGNKKQLPDGVQIDFFRISNPEYYQNGDVILPSSMALDWNNILILLISFVCIFFSYDTFSGEKMNGTLKLMMSNPVSRNQLIMGKYLGICFILFLPFITGVIITVLVLLLSPAIQLSTYQITGILYYVFAAILFISLNVFIGMLISALTSKPIVSLSLVLLVWLVFSIVVPGVGWIISQKTTPVESLNSINDQLSAEDRALGRSRWNGTWKTPTPEVLVNKDHFDKQTEISNRIWNNYRNSLFTQAKSGISVSDFSPFQVFRFLGEQIADVGFSRYQNFYSQVKNYHMGFKDFVIEKDKADKESFHLIWSMPYYTRNFMSLKPVNYEEIPKFEYQNPAFLQKFRGTRWGLLILLGWNVLLLIGIFFAFTVYDVR